MELAFRVSDTPTAREQVFGFVLDEAGEQATEVAVREVLGLPKATTHVALSAHVDQGLTKEKRVGRTGLYSIDPCDPLLKSLKTAQAIRRVQVAIRPLLDELDLVIPFGSASRGENNRTSNVDMSVVANDADHVLTELNGRIGWRGLTAKEYTEAGPLFLQSTLSTPATTSTSEMPFTSAKSGTPRVA